MLRKPNIVVTNAYPRKRIHRAEIEKVVRTVLKREKRRADELTVIFVNDREMLRLSREFLGHNFVTDVVSFNLNEGRAIEGEVYINLDQATRQAKDYNVDDIVEVQRLVVHGVLHLIGYDDATQRQKQIMTKLEDKYIG